MTRALTNMTIISFAVVLFRGLAVCAYLHSEGLEPHQPKIFYQPADRHV